MSIKTFTKCLLFSIAAIGFSGGSVLAASGHIDREDRVVYIYGDDWVDDCQIWVDDDEIEIELRVYDSNGDLDDTDTRDYDIDDVDLIVFYGYSGDDDFWNNSPVPCEAYGDAGNDVLLGGWGNDELHGGTGDDFLAGRSGDDDLFGDGGKDYLYGGTENDYLRAGSGEAEWVIAGQSGADTFASPGNFTWWSRQLVALQRDVYYTDFNPQYDTEYLFWVPQAYYPLASTSYPTRG